MRPNGAWFFGVAWVVSACAPGAEVPSTDLAFCDGDTRHRYAPLASEELLAFPDDAHTLPDETSPTGRRLDLDRMPWVASVPTVLRGVAEAVDGLDGFGRYGAAVLRFTGPLGELPADGGASLTDPGLAWWSLAGDTPERIPFEVSVSEDRTQVILQPLRPLDSGVPHVVLMTTAHVADDGGCVAPAPQVRALLRGVDVPEDLVEHRGRLVEALEALDQPLGSVSAALLFTTHARADVMAEAAMDNARVGTGWSDVSCEPWGDVGHRRCTGTYRTGDYRGPRGDIADASRAADWDLPVDVWLPAGDEPAPVLVYGHGMNGRRGNGGTLANRFVDDGFAVVSVDALEHGDHPTNDPDADDVDGVTFLGLDLSAVTLDGRALQGNFAQSALDRAQLVELVATAPDVDGDGVDDLDADRIAQVGVSLGGMLGAGTLALTDQVDASVLWVAGGHLITFATDTGVVSLIVPLLKDLVGSEDAFDRLLAAAQTAIDPGDPGVLAAHVLQDRLVGDDTARPHVLLPVAMQDTTVPPRTGRMLARALGVPHVPPVAEAVDLLDAAPAAPLAGNLDGVTAGYLQFDRVSDGDDVVPAEHDNTPWSEEGDALLRAWLTSWRSDGVPELIDPYEALDTPPLPPEE